MGLVSNEDFLFSTEFGLQQHMMISAFLRKSLWTMNIKIGTKIEWMYLENNKRILYCGTEMHAQKEKTFLIVVLTFSWFLLVQINPILRKFTDSLI